MLESPLLVPVLSIVSILSRKISSCTCREEPLTTVVRAVHSSSIYG